MQDFRARFGRRLGHAGTCMVGIISPAPRGFTIPSEAGDVRLLFWGCSLRANKVTCSEGPIRVS
jgi:hypothetical protein